MSELPVPDSKATVPSDTTPNSDIVFRGRQLPKSDAELDAFNALEIEEMESRDFIPREIHIQVSKRCNLQCVMRSWQTWKSNTGLMEASLFERILADAKASRVHKIVFGNAQGEPFLHLDIIKMIERSVAEGFWTMVSTNGTPLTPKRIERLAAELEEVVSPNAFIARTRTYLNSIGVGDASGP